MRHQRNVKKELFFRLLTQMRDSCELQLGVKMCLYIYLRKRVLLDSSKGRLWVIFQTSPNMSSKKACSGVNLGGKIARNSHLWGVFSWRGEIAIRVPVCFKNLWSRMCTALVLESLPPPV